MNSDNPNPYADIIDLPHHVSTRHPQMPMEKRANPPTHELNCHFRLLPKTHFPHIKINGESFSVYLRCGGKVK